jgi:hypothetical protein
MHTLLSISILLLLFRIIIDSIALWYKIDRKHGSGKLRDNLIVGLSNLFSIISVIAIILGMLSIFGLNPNEVFTSLSIVAAALAIISKDFIAEKGYDSNFGARPLKRAIQKYIEDNLAEEIIKAEMAEGDSIEMVFDKENNTLKANITKQGPPPKPRKKKEENNQ